LQDIKCSFNDPAALNNAFINSMDLLLKLFSVFKHIHLCLDNEWRLMASFLRQGRTQEVSS